MSIKTASCSPARASRGQEWEVGDLAAIFIDPPPRMYPPAPTISATACGEIQLSPTKCTSSVNIDAVAQRRDAFVFYLRPEANKVADSGARENPVCD